MFTIQLEQIATVEKLKESAFAIKSKAVGLDKESISRYRNDEELLKELAEELITGCYVPQPLKRIEIEKDENETRPLGLSSARDKIVQKLLAMQMMEYFDHLFSNRSYGYRPNKGTLKAINRCRDYIKRGYAYIYKTDIDNFFETIDHNELISLLQKHISDKRIIKIISLFLKNGSFKEFDYIDHSEGVHQGDALSPLLSNIYLDQMDKWLEDHKIEFVRFADDFVLFFKKPKTHKNVVEKLKGFLQSIGLKLEDKKSYDANIKSGFTFLGCRFYQDHILIDNDRLQKKVSKIYGMSKKRWKIQRFISELNSFTESLQQYYLKIITLQSPQFSHLESALKDAVARRLATAFSQKEIVYKKDAKPIISTLLPLTPISKTEKENFVEEIIDKAKAMAKSFTKDLSKKSLTKTKQKFAKKIALNSTLLVDTFGSSLGVSKNRITLKVKGKVVQSIPKNSCEHIIIQNRAVSLSSALIHLCSKQSIPIDFIDSKLNHYASLHTFTQSYAKRAIMQLKIKDDEALSLEFAKAFIKAKLKNQANYIKYLHKHHKEAKDSTAKIRTIAGKIKFAKSTETLMGIEGSASAIYWETLSKIVSDKLEFKGRITQGAADPVNSALNYGYAILYSEVQNALIHAGLALHISFLHALDKNKPTLVFDFIEEFRTFVVDRTIFSMINREEPIEVDDNGMLKKASKKLVAQNVIERLGSYTTYKKAHKRIKTVIQEQAYLLAKAIDNKEKYKGFIGRY